jgi:hypothetical protein
LTTSFSSEGKWALSASGEALASAVRSRERQRWCQDFLSSLSLRQVVTAKKGDLRRLRLMMGSTDVMTGEGSFIIGLRSWGPIMVCSGRAAENEAVNALWTDRPIVDGSYYPTSTL